VARIQKVEVNNGCFQLVLKDSLRTATQTFPKYNYIYYKDTGNLQWVQVVAGL